VQLTAAVKQSVTCALQPAIADRLADSPSVTTIVRGAVAFKPPSPSSASVTVQVVLPDLVWAGVKLSTPASVMAGGSENSWPAVHAMLIVSCWTCSPGPAEMALAQGSL
jgi:hypothetical protein